MSACSDDIVRKAYQEFRAAYGGYTGKSGMLDWTMLPASYRAAFRAGVEAAIKAAYEPADASEEPATR